MADRMISYSVRLTEEQMNWLEKEDGPKAETLREAVDQLRENDAGEEIVTDGGQDVTLAVDSDHPYADERRKLRSYCHEHNMLVFECPGCSSLMDILSEGTIQMLDSNDLAVFVCTQCGSSAELSHVSPRPASEVDQL